MRCHSPRFVGALLAVSSIQCSVDDRVTGLDKGRAEPDAGQGGSAGSASVAPAENAGGSADSSGPCSNACTAGSAECTASGVQTCELQASGCTAWVLTSLCGPNQTCRAEAGTVSCSCNANACAQAGMACQDALTLATCASDESGCLVVSATLTCTGGQACSGLPPSSSCSLTCTDSCSVGQTACLPGGLATCSVGSNGCAAYGTPVACGEHQSCLGAAGSAECACAADPVCASAAAACASPSLLATCSADADGCFFASSTSPCDNGACSGNACCSNTCAVAPAQCGSSSSLEACSVGSNGCTSVVSTACGTGLVCERVGEAACADPNWAEWPMPNAVQDVNAGAPNPENYSDNADGTATDTRTKLRWQTGTSPSTVSWDTAGGVGSAQAYCSGLTLAGFSDWRLPTLIELFSLLDIGATDPGNGKIISLFPTPTDTFFWSATPSADDAGFAWSLYYSSFLDAFNNVDQVSAPGLARCVR